MHNPDPTQRRWWCASDGFPARYDHPSLDPLHPFGVCSRLVGPYKVAAHGGHPVPIVGTEWERDRLSDQARAAAQRKRHAAHLRGKLSRSCPYCNQERDRIFAQATSRRVG